MTISEITADIPAPAPDQASATTDQDRHPEPSTYQSPEGAPDAGHLSPEPATDTSTSDGASKRGRSGSDLAASGTGAGQSDAPRVVIGAQESSAINANLAGLAAGTVRLAT